MKKCKYCETENYDSAIKCTGCGAREFSYICSNCGTIFDSNFCPSCGTKAGAKMKKCPNCGTEYMSAACPQCGYIKVASGFGNEFGNENFNNASWTESKDEKSPKSFVVTLLLAIFLGFFGGHQYYVGRIGRGLLYTFTCGLFYFGWLIDIIKLITGKFRDSEGRIVSGK